MARLRWRATQSFSRQTQWRWADSIRTYGDYTAKSVMHRFDSSGYATSVSLEAGGEFPHD
jgi:hypothetical protein